MNIYKKFYLTFHARVNFANKKDIVLRHIGLKRKFESKILLCICYISFRFKLDSKSEIKRKMAVKLFKGLKIVSKRFVKNNVLLYLIFSKTTPF